MTEPLLVEREGEVVTLRFNRPDRLNAIDVPMAEALRDAAAALAREGSARCVVLAGAGRAFMAGGDVTAFDGPDAIGTIMDPMHEALALLAALDAPVLASVQGAAAGGGMSVALAADLCIAADDARFSLAYLRLGTSPDCGGSWNLARLVGMRRALGIALLEETLDAAAAKEAGLVNRVVPAAELAEATRTLARKLASGPRAATAATKRLLREASGHGLEQHLDAERAAFLGCAASADFAEGVAAFLARRPPQFPGR
jgi:2-(1,2-epoxy-1,2-dihydrophenyl)acetyl-CoA isomerase